MAFCSDDMKPPCSQDLVMALLPLRLDFINFFLARIAQGFNFSLPFAPQDNISSPSCHIGGDSHCAGPACLSNNFCLLGMEFGIQHFMADFLFAQVVGKYL